MSIMTERNRVAARALQDRAIKAIELLHPNVEDLDNKHVCSNGPKVGRARRILFSEWRWLWLDWIEQGKTAGHDI